MEQENKKKEELGFAVASFYEKEMSQEDLHIVSRTCSASSSSAATKSVDNGSYFITKEEIESSVLLGRVQRCGLLREILAEHVLGTESYLYNIDPGRMDLCDAATELKKSNFLNAALTCSAWLGMAAAVLDWEKQRFLDENRLILDPYIFPLVTGSHLEALPRKAIFNPQKHRAPKNWQDPPRFCRLPFKEGDVAIVDVDALLIACEGLAQEYSNCSVFAGLATEAHALKANVRTISTSRNLTVRCRLSSIQCVALPVHQNENHWRPARGPGGRILIEVGTFSLQEHVFEHSSIGDYAAASTEDLAAGTGISSSISTRFNIIHKKEDEKLKSFNGFTPPLPLLEPGIILAIIPALYRKPRLDWHPDITLTPGSTFCAIYGRKHILLGHAYEIRESSAAHQIPPPTDSRDFAARFAQRFFAQNFPEQNLQAGPRQILFVRDMLDGTSATHEAASWGMALWNQGALDVFDQPIPSSLAVGESHYAPPALAHLVLDCSTLGHPPDLGTRERFAMPRCAICGKQNHSEVSGNYVVTSTCPHGCCISGCAIRHLNMARQDHALFCPRRK